MTRVDFYILPDGNPPERYACKVANKARQQGHDIYIHTDNKENANRMDDLLWTYKDISFLPHSLVDSAELDTVNVSIGWSGHEPPPAQVLINLGNSIPEFVGNYERVVEMVAADPTMKNQARERYRQYRESGFELHNHQIKS